MRELGLVEAVEEETVHSREVAERAIVVLELGRSELGREKRQSSSRM